MAFIKIKVNDSETRFEAVDLNLFFEYNKSFSINNNQIMQINNLEFYKFSLDEDGARKFVENNKKKPKNANAYEIELFDTGQFSYRYFQLPDEILEKLIGSD